MIKLATLFTAFISISTMAANKDPNYCENDKCDKYNVASTFVVWEKLTTHQQRILLNSGIGAANYESWAYNNDAHAASFLAITTALSRFKMKLSDGVSVTGVEAMERVQKFEGDRIHVQINKAVFADWQKANSSYELETVTGNVETGKMKFRDHSYPGGSLHKGYDIQAFTSMTKVPRIQINYRFSDSVADIDIDRYAPFIWGIFPNPKHLTYKNSDPRQWLKNLIEKFGNPGFAVTAAKVK